LHLISFSIALFPNPTPTLPLHHMPIAQHLQELVIRHVSFMATTPSLSKSRETELHAIILHASKLVHPDLVLRPFQHHCLKAIANAASDSTTLVSLGTGHGKTNIFWTLRYVVLETQRKKSGVLVVVSPLKALIACQVSELGPRAYHVGCEVGKLTNDEVVAKVESGEFHFLYTCPETYMKRKEWFHQLNILGVIIDDEAHLLVTCDYRDEYQSILRHIPRNIMLVLLSGTFTQVVKKDLRGACTGTRNMSSFMLVDGPVEKPNTFYIASIISSLTRYENLQWLVDLMWAFEKRPQDMTHSVIYCLTTNDTLRVLRFLIKNSPSIFSKRIIRYHADMEDEKGRREMVTDFKRPGIESNTSVLV